MYYSINVSMLDEVNSFNKPLYRHLFATAEHSIGSEYQLKKVYPLIKKRFPEPNFRVDVTRWESCGTTIDTKSLEKDM